MWKGTIVEVDGKRYKIQRVEKEGVYASKMVTETKCQKGRPSKFSHSDVAVFLGVDIEDLFTRPKKLAPRPENWDKAAKPIEGGIDSVDEDKITPPMPTDAEIKAKEARKAKVVERLIEMFGTDSADDW